MSEFPATPTPEEPPSSPTPTATWTATIRPDPPATYVPSPAAASGARASIVAAFAPVASFLGLEKTHVVEHPEDNRNGLGSSRLQEMSGFRSGVPRAEPALAARKAYGALRGWFGIHEILTAPWAIPSHVEFKRLLSEARTAAPAVEYVGDEDGVLWLGATPGAWYDADGELHHDRDVAITSPQRLYFWHGKSVDIAFIQNPQSMGTWEWLRDPATMSSRFMEGLAALPALGNHVSLIQETPRGSLFRVHPGSREVSGHRLLIGAHGTSALMRDRGKILTVAGALRFITMYKLKGEEEYVTYRRGRRDAGPVYIETRR